MPGVGSSAMGVDAGETEPGVVGDGDDGDIGPCTGGKSTTGGRGEAEDDGADVDGTAVTAGLWDVGDGLRDGADDTEALGRAVLEANGGPVWMDDGSGETSASGEGPKMFCELASLGPCPGGGDV